MSHHYFHGSVQVTFSAMLVLPPEEQSWTSFGGVIWCQIQFVVSVPSFLFYLVKEGINAFCSTFFVFLCLCCFTQELNNAVQVT